MAGSENEASKGQKDRSPSFPFISLKTAIGRLEKFEEYFKRHPAPAAKAGLAWGLKEKSSQAFQTLAALKAFGLLDYQGKGDTWTASVSEDGRTYLRAQQALVKQQVLKRVALKPKAIAKYWRSWLADRPPDPIALDELMLKGSFTDSAAKTFLKVYDETIAFAGLSNSDKPPPEEDGNGDEDETDGRETLSPPPPPASSPPPPIPLVREQKVMAGERELLSGMLSKDANFRLIVRGNIGIKEIDRLIAKLQYDREILAEQDSPDGDPSMEENDPRE